MTEPGFYRHYKGHVYEVVMTATHSETLEPMVVYRDNRMSGRTWVRPEEMFHGNVSVDGKTVPRFERIDP